MKFLVGYSGEIPLYFEVLTDLELCVDYVTRKFHPFLWQRNKKLMLYNSATLLEYLKKQDRLYECDFVLLNLELFQQIFDDKTGANAFALYPPMLIPTNFGGDRNGFEKEVWIIP